MTTTTVRRGIELIGEAALCAAACVALVVISHETNGAISTVSYLIAVALGISAPGLMSVGIKKISLARRAE